MLPPKAATLQAFRAWTISKHPFFGPTILTEDGRLNRAQLRDLVFQNPQEKNWLEKTLHPIIRDMMKQQAQALQTPYCIFVIPLLIETQHLDVVDRILVVDTPESLKIQRTQQRSQLSEAQIRTIMQAQCTRAERLKAADDVITNDGDITALQQQVETLHLKYLEMTTS